MKIKNSESMDLSRPILPAPNDLFPLGPSEKQSKTIELEKLSTRLYDPEWSIAFNFSHFKGLAVIARHGDVIEQYFLYELWGANGSHLQHLVLQDPVFMNSYLQRMKVKYREYPESAVLEDKSRTPQLEHVALKYAILDYSDLAFKWGINELLRGNDQVLIDKLISLEIRVSPPHFARERGFVLTHHSEWRLWWANSQLRMEEIKIDNIPGLKQELEGMEKKSISFQAPMTRVKRILLSNLALISSVESENSQQIIIDMIGTILAASYALRDYHTHPSEAVDAEQKLASEASKDKYRVLKWEETRFPNAWNQDQFYLEDPAFISASAGKIAFGSVLEPEELGVLVYFPDSYDRNIKNLSAHSREQEHLLEPGSQILMKKIDEFGQWKIFQGIVYSTFDNFPFVDQDRVQLYMSFLLERFYRKKEFGDIKISAQDSQAVVDGYLIYKPNHNMVNAVRQMEMGRQILLIFSEFSITGSEEQKFYQSLSADKDGSIHTEISLVLMSLSIGRESEISIFEYPELYLQYRKNSFDRFLQFFTEQFPEEKDPADAFVKFFRPISTDADEVLKARFAIYRNILLNLGSPDYISKSQGLELYLHQILNTAHMLDHIRCLPRKKVMENLTVHLKSTLREEGLRKLPILVDYSLACIDATGDRIVEAGIDYRPCFAEFSLNPAACQRKLRQVPTPIFKDWPEDQKMHDVICKKAAQKLFDFYKESNKEKFLLASLPVDLLDSKISADSLLAVMNEAPIRAVIRNYVLALKKSNKLFVFYEKGVINQEFLKLISSLNPEIRSAVILLVAKELVHNSKDFEDLYLLLNHREQFYLFLKELGEESLSRIIKDNSVFIHWMVKLKDAYFKNFLLGYGQQNLIKQLTVCLESKQNLDQIKKMGLHEIDRLLVLLDSLKNGDHETTYKLMANLLKIIFSYNNPSQWLSLHPRQVILFLGLLRDLKSMDLFFNKQNVKEFAELKKAIMEILNNMSYMFDARSLFMMTSSYIITSSKDLIALVNNVGIFREPGGSDAIIKLLDDKQLAVICGEGKNFVEAVKGLKDIHRMHAKTLIREYAVRVDVNFEEFIIANKEIILSSLEESCYYMLDEFLPVGLLDKLFPEAQRLADKPRSNSGLFSQRPKVDEQKPAPVSKTCVIC